MNRDLHRDPAYQCVRALSLSRLACGLVLLPLCGWNGWWALAAFAFVLAFLTDMLDGALARVWNVATKSGERLDSNADAALTFGALLAATVGDGWPWFVLVLLTAAYLAINWVESQLRGDVLGTFLILVPAVNLTLIAMLAARFVQLAGGVSYGAVLSAQIAVGALLVYLKRHRIAEFARMAIERSMD